AQVGEELEHIVERPAAEAPGLLEAQLEVLADGEGGEDLAVLRHVADAGAGDEVAAAPRDVLALPHHLAHRLHEAHDGLAGGGAADPVAAEQAHDLATAHLEVHTLQDVTLTVVGVQVVDREHQASAPSTGAPR